MNEWGPLAALAGTWEGNDGLDVSYHNVRGAVGETGYFEKVELKPFGPVDNGKQSLYGLDYRMAAWRFPETSAADIAAHGMEVTLDHGRLYTRIHDGAPAALIAVTPTLFRRADEPDATCAFIRGEDGALYFQEDENYVKDELGDTPPTPPARREH